RDQHGDEELHEAEATLSRGRGRGLRPRGPLVIAQNGHPAASVHARIVLNCVKDQPAPRRPCMRDWTWMKRTGFRFVGVVIAQRVSGTPGNFTPEGGAGRAVVR